MPSTFTARSGEAPCRPRTSSPGRCPRPNCTSTSRARSSPRWSSPWLSGTLCSRQRARWRSCGSATASTISASFLALYYESMTSLITRQDFADLTEVYLRRAVDQGVRHVELFFDPQAHTVRGIAIDTVLDGLLDGWQVVQADARPDRRSDHVLPPRPAGLRGDGHLARGAHRLDDLLAVGLDSAEQGYPPSLFADVFAAARSDGLRVVAHAGEEGPADYVREALDVLGVERIDHGVRCLEDAPLVERLRREQIPLTVCPLVESPAGRGQRPGRAPACPAMLARGLLVTVNSDDPAYFGGYVADNYAAVLGADVSVGGRSRALGAQLDHGVVRSGRAQVRAAGGLSVVETRRIEAQATQGRGGAVAINQDHLVVVRVRAFRPGESGPEPLPAPPVPIERGGVENPAALPLPRSGGAPLDVDVEQGGAPTSSPGQSDEESAPPPPSARIMDDQAWRRSGAPQQMEEDAERVHDMNQRAVGPVGDLRGQQIADAVLELLRVQGPDRTDQLVACRIAVDLPAPGTPPTRTRSGPGRGATKESADLVVDASILQG